MYLVLDLETSMKGGHGRGSNPFIDRILCIGLKYQHKRGTGQFDRSYPEPSEYIDDLFAYADDTPDKGWLKDVNLIIGHNIKFDLLYLWRNDELQHFFRANGRIWDTQLAEYILSGQRHKYPALRDIAVNKYGCAERIKNIEGKNTEEVDTELLLEDVKNDVLDTEAIALKQVKMAKEKGMMGLMLTQMDALLSTTEMEFNGFKIDKAILEKNQKILEEQLIEPKDNLKELVSKHWPSDIIFNSASPKQLTTLFFGGKRLVKVRKPVQNELGVIETFKNGNVKYKTIDVEEPVEGLGLIPHKDWVTPKGGISVNEKTLKLIALKKNHDAATIAKYMLELRHLEKMINTYYIGIKELVYSWDSCVHPQFSHCGYGNDYNNDDTAGGTQTGRLSCTKPNVQNLPRSQESAVREHFVSRYTDGTICEFDFNQLEVVLFAYLTKDIQLIDDIKSGRDIHCVLGSELYGEEITKRDDRRQRIKPCTFLVIYGGSYKKLAREQKLDESFCKSFVETFYRRYPMAKAWQDRQVGLVNGSKYKIAEQTPKGFEREEGFLKNLTGRLLYFKTNDAPDFLVEKGQMTGFNPAEIKNYPVQSMATADIALMKFGQVWRKAIEHKDKFLLVNTVHDSIVIDCKKEFVDFACNLVIHELQLIKEPMKKYFNLDWDLPLGVECKIGNNWREVGLK